MIEYVDFAYLVTTNEPDSELLGFGFDIHLIKMFYPKYLQNFLGQFDDLELSEIEFQWNIFGKKLIKYNKKNGKYEDAKRDIKKFINKKGW